MSARDTTRPARRAAFRLGLLAVLGLAGCTPPSFLQETPDAIAFRPAKDRIPGTLVRSEDVRLTGFRGRKPVPIHAEGDAEQLFVNGKPMGKYAKARGGDRVALAVRAPDYGKTATGTVQVGNTKGELRVSALGRPPGTKLAFGEVAISPGRTAYSRLVAPTGFAPGTRLTVAGADARVQVETRQGRFDPPLALTPGEPFRLVTRVPEGWTGQHPIKIALGEQQGVWTIRVPEPG